MRFDRVCVDASLALAWVIPAQASEDANALRQDWYETGVELLGPQMFRAEVTSVLREEVFFKRMPPEEGEEGFAVYLEIPIRIISSPDVYRKAWELAIDYNQRRTYDMQYLAVAELEDCELWTLDKKLVTSLHGKTKRVKWVGDFKKRR